MSPFRAEPVRGQQQQGQTQDRIGQSKEQETRQTALCLMDCFRKRTNCTETTIKTNMSKMRMDEG